MGEQQSMEGLPLELTSNSQKTSLEAHELHLGIRTTTLVSRLPTETPRASAPLAPI